MARQQKIVFAGALALSFGCTTAPEVSAPEPSGPFLAQQTQPKPEGVSAGRTAKGPSANHELSQERSAQPGARSPSDKEDAKRMTMNNELLGQLISRVSDKVEGQAGFWSFQVEGVTLMVVTDESADRMRIMAGVTESKNLSAGRLTRLLQANFDSALDARYAIAKETVWAAFIHPLSPLTEVEFFSGLAQVVNLVETFGTTYSSGALIFGGGDSAEKQRELHQRMLEKVETHEL